MRCTTRILGTAALLLTVVPITATTVGSQSDAMAAAPGRFVSGWIPNWSSAVVADGTSALTNGQQAVFADVSPFGFTAVAADTIATSGSESSLTAAVTALRNNKLPVLPTISDGTAKLVMAGILADPAQRTIHVQAITDLVVNRNYDGIDLDYEGFAFTDGRASWITTRPNWAAFVIELGASLHAHGKLLSVTVPPIWDSGSSGYFVYSWQDRAADLDILPAIDRLRLMVYDYNVAYAGPVSPMVWVNNVLSYVKAVVPTNQLRKVQMGVPTYGRSWAKVLSGSCPTDAPTATVGVQMENVGGLLAKAGATLVRDPSGEMKLIYDEVFTGSGVDSPAPPYVPPSNRSNDVSTADAGGLRTAVRLGGATCTIRRTVYYPDELTVVQHANAALQAGLSGIVIWALGYETDALWAQLMGVAVDRPDGTAPQGNLDLVEPVGSDLHIRGWVMDPEFDVPITFTVSVAGVAQSSGAIVARDYRSDLPYTNKMHGFDVVVPMPTGHGVNVCVNTSGYGAATAAVSFCATST
jgi:Glycosyl hydrolases family 18